MIVNTKTKKELASLLRFFKALGYNVEVKVDDWDSYEEKTCIKIDHKSGSIKEFSSINYYKSNSNFPVNSYDDFIELTIDGNIRGFPLDVVTAMIVQQKNQGNPPDLLVFRDSRYVDKPLKGFNWKDTFQGQEYWKDIIENRNFENFNYLHATRIK
jgi:hypothetical protein